MITIKIAGLPIGIDNRYEYIVLQAQEYLTDEEPLFTVKVTDEDIEKEKEVAIEDFSDDYLESIGAYRKIAEILPSYDAFLFHGAVLELDEKAYIITANSGVGKTTHVRLWMSEFPEEVSILNGDKPVLRFIDGIPYASGTPWRGKECYGKNSMKPIAGIAFLSRGEKNKAFVLKTSDAAHHFVSQVYMPKTSSKALIKSLELSDRLLKCVKLVRLECNMERDAAHVCREALTK